MTDLDRASLDRVLPSTPGSADWDDVMSRSRARQGRRRRRLVVLAAAALVAVVGTASAFGGVRDLFLDKGFIGLPPVWSDAQRAGERRTRPPLDREKRDPRETRLRKQDSTRPFSARGCTPTGE